jgi:hypothetical protein
MALGKLVPIVRQVIYLLCVNCRAGNCTLCTSQVIGKTKYKTFKCRCPHHTAQIPLYGDFHET